MKSIKITTLTILLSIVFSTNMHAQFFKKLQKKIDRKIEQVINPDEKESEDSAGDISENTSNEKNENYRNYDDFITGETIIFKDYPDNNETKNKTPSKWNITNINKKDNTIIIEKDGEKVIQLGPRQGIAPIITNNKEDYLPNQFTFEFDASFSANSLDQRYYISFYDQKEQEEIVPYETQTNEITLTTFGVTDDLTQGTLNGAEYYQKSSAPVWRHIAMTYKNNELEVYYDGQHIFHKGDIKGNMIGITISRSELSGNDRYLKNIIIATN